MRAPVSRGDTRPLAWRRLQLDRLGAFLEAVRQDMTAALEADLGKPPVEASFEWIAVHQELRLARRRLRRWLRPQRVPMPAWALPGKAELRPEPLGCVLILGPWNYPFSLCLQPLVSALAAGNAVVLKPSEHAPATAALIARRLGEHFPAELVVVVQGDGEVAARLLEQRFDHVFFTGGGRVGRLVMAAAARHLTPVTLELGGKSPAIVLPDADPATTARRLCWGKGINAGQTCVAPDHLLLTPGVRDVLVPQLAAAIRGFYGEVPLRSPDLARIVNAARYERLEALLSDARRSGRVVLGGATDPRQRRIEPTLIRVDDPDRDPLMQEELFGPLLPMVEVADLETALERIRRGPSPLALYLFGGDAAARQRVLDSTSSGSVVFNDVILQAGIAALRFGGVGESGMGAYHGEAGFFTFSHRRPVVRRSLWPDLPFRYPPYAGKRRLLERLLG
jgi:aldehyde dehydrogenase (NAD+)